MRGKIIAMIAEAMGTMWAGLPRRAALVILLVK
jgi:hypothetical protein